LVLVKTISGTASAVGEAIDGLKLDGILGTVAGDNAVLVVSKDGYPASEILQSLRNIAGM
jgi:transcriptional regulator of arginine metabolism